MRNPRSIASTARALVSVLFELPPFSLATATISTALPPDQFPTKYHFGTDASIYSIGSRQRSLMRAATRLAARRGPPITIIWCVCQNAQNVRYGVVYQNAPIYVKGRFPRGHGSLVAGHAAGRTTRATDYHHLVCLPKCAKCPVWRRLPKCTHLCQGAVPARARLPSCWPRSWPHDAGHRLPSFGVFAKMRKMSGMASFTKMHPFMSSGHENGSARGAAPHRARTEMCAFAPCTRCTVAERFAATDSRVEAMSACWPPRKRADANIFGHLQHLCHLQPSAVGEGSPSVM